MIHYIRVGHVNIIPSDVAMPSRMASQLPLCGITRMNKKIIKNQWFSIALLTCSMVNWRVTEKYWRSQQLNRPSMQKNATNPSPQTKSPWERCWCVKFKGDERLCKACNEMTWIGENGNPAEPLAKLQKRHACWHITSPNSFITWNYFLTMCWIELLVQQQQQQQQTKSP